MFEEDDGVVVPHRRFQQALGVVGSAGGDDLEARGMEEVGFDVLRVKKSAPNPAAVGDSHGHGDVQCAVGAVAGPGGLADQLVNGRPDEVGELYLRDRPLPAEGRAQGDADDGRFRQGRVDDPVFAELLHQALGGQKDSAPYAHVFTHDEDAWVALHLFPDRLSDGFDYAFYGHCPSPMVILPMVRLYFMRSKPCNAGWKRREGWRRLRRRWPHPLPAGRKRLSRPPAPGSTGPAR